MPEAKLLNTSVADVAATNESLISEMGSNSPEIVLDAMKSIKQNQDSIDKNCENSTDLIQRLEDISIDDGQYNNESKSDQLCLVKEATDEGDTLKVGKSSMLSKLRPELLSFAGDWPIEQTLRQRTPRRKKQKPKNGSFQQPMEEERNMDCHVEEMADNTIPISFEDLDTSEPGFAVKASEESHSNQDDLQNPLYTEVKSERVNDSAVETFFKILKQGRPNSLRCRQDVDNVKAEPETVAKSSRRNCKQCKLALTFSNSCSSLSKSDDTPPPFKLTEAVDQSFTSVCQSSQTEPYDFAMAWRAEKKNSDVIRSLRVLVGQSARFMSKPLESNENLQDNIPYRMVHHKSTFVDENEISSLADENGLHILCKLFKSLSFDVLKDLFERCNQDLQWATNLLLDSGEKMYKDEPEDIGFGYEGEIFEQSKDKCKLEVDRVHHEDTVPTNGRSEISEEPSSSFKGETFNIQEIVVTAPENATPLNNVPLVVAEELKSGNVLSSSSNVPALTNPCTVLNSHLPEHDMISETVEAHIMWSSSLEGGLLNSPDVLTNNRLNEKTSKGLLTQDISGDVAVLCETGDNLGQLPMTDVCEEQESAERPPIVEEQVKPQISYMSQPKESIKFDYLELSLPPEFAFQLTELFGPVGIDPGALTIEDCVVPVDLKLAEAIHKKWKESIMERHNQEALSYQLIAEADHLPDDHINLDRLLQEQESRLVEKYSVASLEEINPFPFMDQWNAQTKKVSLRQIMSEEMALQAREDMKKSVPPSNCAVKMKEKQLLELFPNVEQNLLIDIFKESNYSLEKTEEFMSCLLESDPVQNVVAPGFKQEVMSADKTKEKKLKAAKEVLYERYFQDLEFPDYNDFRAEAFLYRQKQQESFRKAAEAHNRGMKQVAAYYAQQGYLYGQKMKEEHQRAAVHIFERANEYLLPENILDLHGLHVDEAMKHFRRVLQDKTEDYKQNGGKPHLLVITGRGNHSQGGMPRIKPAVLDYLTNHNYRFQEKTSGVLRITLKRI